MLFGTGTQGKVDLLLADVHEDVVCTLATECVPCPAPTPFPWHRIDRPARGLAARSVVLAQTAYSNRIEPPPTSPDHALTGPEVPTTGRRPASHRATVLTAHQ